MKNSLKFLAILLITLFFSNNGFAIDIPLPLPGITATPKPAAAPALSESDRKVLQDFIKILQDPNKVQALIKTLNSQNAPVVVEPESQHADILPTDIGEILDLAHNTYTNLGLYEKMQLYWQDFKSDLFSINYKNLGILVLVIALINIALLVIEYFYSKAYDVKEYRRDFVRYYKRNHFLKGHFLLFFINIKYFLPTILPASLLMTAGKISTNIVYEWILNLFVFTVILMLLLRFLKIIFYDTRGSDLIRLRFWLFLLLWLLFIFLSLHYVFTAMEDFALVKLNIAFFVLVALFYVFRLRFLFKVINHKALTRHMRGYKRFLLHAKRYSITLLYMAVYAYIISVVFLDSGITKSIIMKLLYVIIGILCIYLVQTYLAKIIIKDFMIKKSTFSANISKMIFANATERSSIEFTFFWRVFNVFYYVIFALIYVWFFDRVLDTNLVVKLNAMSSYRVVSILFSVLLAFSFLMAITFVIVAFAERYIAKTAEAGDLDRLKKMLTLYKILQKPYKIIFCIIFFIFILSSIGVSLTALLASTGAITVLLAFGMKDILQNFFNSIMFFLENSFSLNDYIDLGGSKGTVEEISMVYIKIRDIEGNLIMIPFKNIGTITNYSKDYSFALVNVGVAYNSNLDKVFALLKTISEEMKADKTIGKLLLAPLEIIGVTSLDDSSINVRCRIKIAPGKQTSVRTMFLRKIHDTFGREGIDIPFPQRVIHIQ
ncbi:MAG: mechanosensitive ion channel family protein [Alphaproteobacteria bacterium]|jgi:small conductance mechanosensitive channel|nr:mechanosensitive ion channel family protein [Alphaproteobacteria bacterium]